MHDPDRRGLGNVDFAFNAATTDSRASNYQSQASPNRFWIKTLIVETSISAPQITTLTTGLAAAQTSHNSLQARVSLLEELIGALNARVYTLENN